MTRDSVGDWGGTRPPENMPQGTNPDPDGGRPPPGEATFKSARRPAWLRLSVLILATAAALAVPIAIIFTVSAGPNPGGATGTGAAGAPSSVPPTPSVPVPTADP